MTAFKAWVDELAPGVPPKSALGEALAYTISQWDKSSRFLEHPEVPAHNNRVENDSRPFALGKRAWLFTDTQYGATASANLYSVIGDMPRKRHQSPRVFDPPLRAAAAGDHAH